jgi:AcrR family transcriptional regulator
MKKDKDKITYHHGDLKRVLLEVAIYLLKKEGYQSLSLRKIAKLAGVSQSAPYRHYNDLEELYADIASEGFKLLTTKLKKVKTRYSKYPLLQFRESGIAYVEFAIKNPDLFQIMYGNQILSHSKYEFLIQSEEEAFLILKNILMECKEQGLIKTNEIEQASMSAWTMVHGLAVLLAGKQVMFRNIDLKNAKTITKEMIQFLYVGLK